MGRLGLHLRKKLLIEPSPSGLCDIGSPNEHTFAERLRGVARETGLRFRWSAKAMAQPSGERSV